ncbi:MAG: TlyA family RNA methyltransferase [Actinobacteria bacterium]|nr:TlyA family RNA methyltransferase [Actinomycetota bacterium]
MPEKKYVSRGGFKLEGAAKDFNLKIYGKRAIDVGSSTGGFTDFLLKNGATEVIAIDVGYGLLDWNLRNSGQVIVFERTNIRYLDPGILPFKADITVVDVSFISIKKILRVLTGITVPSGEILLLIKPQFELAKKDVERGGVIRSERLHRSAVLDMVQFIRDFPVEIKGISYSKIRGTKGNMEFWIYLKNLYNTAKSVQYYDKIIGNIVSGAHEYFGVK